MSIDRTVNLGISEFGENRLPPLNGAYLFPSGIASI
jgi:hypothetical protein